MAAEPDLSHLFSVLSAALSANHHSEMKGTCGGKECVSPMRAERCEQPGFEAVSRRLPRA